MGAISVSRGGFSRPCKWLVGEAGGRQNRDVPDAIFERTEIEQLLTDAGYEVVEVRDAPDRPGRELVFLARRAS